MRTVDLAVSAITGAALCTLALAPQLRTAEDVAAPTSPPSRVERLIDRHHCWTQTAPEGVIPAHAVVTLPGDMVAHMAPASVGFAIWKEGRAGTLHAFCP